MPTQWETWPIKLEGGLITNLGRLEQGIQAPGSATTLVNYEPSVEKGYSKISGFEKFINDVVPGTGMIHGVVALTATSCLVERAGKWQYNEGLGWVEKATLANSLINNIDSDRYNFDGIERAVIVDGVNDPCIFNYSTKLVTYLAGVPSDVSGASQVVVFKNHLFFVKNNLLTFTAPYTDDDFTAANGAGVINIGETITGVKVFREQLIVFSRNGIKRLVGNTLDDFQLVEITRNTGCLDGRTVQEVGGDLIYLGPDGLRYLSATERNEDFGLARASEKIQSEITSLVTGANIYSSVTISSKNQYRFFSYRSNVPSRNSEGYVATKYSDQSVDNISWAKLVGFKPYHIDKYQDTKLEVVLFTSDTGYVYVMDRGSSFDGEDIECIFSLPYMPINDPKIRKTVYKHTLYGTPTGPFSIDATVKYDYESEGSSMSPSFTISGGAGTTVYGSPIAIYGTSVYGSSPDENYYNNVLGSGFVVSVNYYEKSSNPPFSLNFVILEYRTNERR